MRRFFFKLWRRRSLERDLEAELTFHREMSRKNGNPIPLGNGSRIKEASRDFWRFGQIEDAWRDLVYAARQLRRSPAFALTVIVTLALGVGANGTIFSIADGVLFRPLPYEDPDRVFVVEMLNRPSGQVYWRVPYEFVAAIEAQARTVAQVGMSTGSVSPIVEGEAGPERVPALAVTPDYFDALGVEAAYGRLVDSEDLSDGGRAVVLSHASWQQRFGGRKEIVGTSVVLGDTPLDVVGVLPRGLIFPSPMVGDPEIVSVTAPPEPGDGVLNPIVRLESGATLEAAQAEIDTLAIQISPDQVPVLTEVRDILYRAPTPAMRFLMGASVLVMLVGCAHLTNLLMTRSHQRTWETGVRAALGASRARLVRPLVFEALLLGAAGAIVAVLVTVVSYDVLFPLVPPNAYGNAPVGVGVRVIVFAMALSLLGGLVFTVAPAWRSAALDVLTIIRKQQQADAIGSGTFGRPMLAVQVGLAIVLVTGSVIAGRTLLGVLNVPLGFEPENVITAHVPPPPDLLQGLDRQAFYTRAMESLEGLSDVVSVGAALTLPFDGAAQWRGVVGPDGQPLPAGTDHVLPGYFETAGIRTVRGRLFDWDDVRAGASVAVASEEFASIVFGDRDPIGESFEDNGGRRFTVIGMVDDAIRTLSDDSFFQPRAYVIPGQETRQMSLVIRTNARSEVLLRDVQRQLIDLAPGAALRIGWWSDSIDSLAAYRNPKFQAVVLGTFGGLALGLTGLGVAGVVTFLVGLRRREMGIRLALGAGTGSLSRLMVRQTVIPVLTGAVFGLVVTPALARLAESQFLEIQPPDLWTRASAFTTVLVVALVAAWLPARRAGRINPMSVLRSE